MTKNIPEQSSEQPSEQSSDRTTWVCKLTPQEVREIPARELANHAIAALLRQGRFSYRVDVPGERGVCLYRFPQPDGTILACAGGHVFPDEVYLADRDESHTLNNISFFHELEPAKRNLLRKLQEIHDGAAHGGEFESLFWQFRRLMKGTFPTWGVAELGLEASLLARLEAWTSLNTINGGL